ncbi:MAG: pilus assembly protein [Planctomycetales bacterium]|nr:pilus assembly protein [Planctomycetales bacterium]
MASRTSRSVARIADLRRGAAVVELAICLPLLVMLVFGSLQACNLIYLKHAITAAAYEGTLELAKPNATNATVLARVQQVLDARGVVSTNALILPSGSDVNAVATGTALTISVTANSAANLSFSGFFLSPATLSSNIVATR